MKTEETFSGIEKIEYQAKCSNCGRIGVVIELSTAESRKYGVTRTAPKYCEECTDKPLEIKSESNLFENIKDNE